ncbi:hypothetical protein [uncultured Alistipes sp.]|uniref:hypothetical protein n=1 Tax=uncultured Alistipes sp. TaxID=538949 RepID=UPI0025D32901|nr:hypothetical protein [uncultured Alistipes sp.]
MFNGLRQGSLFFILHKSGDRPHLKIGQVVSVSNPRPKKGAIAPYGMPTETVIDVSVKVEEETYNFDALDSNASVKLYPDQGVFIADSREQMLAEVEAMHRNSAQIIESVPYHQNVLEACDAMKCSLNPQLAKEKEQEEKIGALESKITGVESTLCTIQDMLAKALSTSGGSRKQNEK